jgi:hypothetical protein
MLSMTCRKKMLLQKPADGFLIRHFRSSVNAPGGKISARLIAVSRSLADAVAEAMGDASDVGLSDFGPAILEAAKRLEIAEGFAAVIYSRA